MAEFFDASNKNWLRKQLDMGSATYGLNPAVPCAVCGQPTGIAYKVPAGDIALCGPCVMWSHFGGATIAVVPGGSADDGD